MYELKPHSGFEIVDPDNEIRAIKDLPSGQLFKYAYGGLYPLETTDLEIELDELKRLEVGILPKDREISKLKEGYKRVISILDREMSAGWNAWSELILELFLCDSLHKIMFGSGNCGKSRTYAMLLYIKWRVNPTQRLILIASAVMADSGARVFGYLEKIHAKSPPLEKGVKAVLKTTKDNTGLFNMVLDRESGKYIIDDHACIISLPVKVNAKREELGANLMGKHPKELYVIAFDEGQELDGSLIRGRIYFNLQTNSNVEIHAWGNPPPIRWHEPESWDMLTTLGLDKLSLTKVRELESNSNKNGWWKNGVDTTVLHLSMLDSPKDKERQDCDESKRLSFLGGKDIIDKLKRNNADTNSTSWYSQILGFPFIDENSSGGRNSVTTPSIVAESRTYPLVWADNKTLKYFMGVDPTGTGYNDSCSVSVARVGLMVDGRTGIDLMNGRYNKSIRFGKGSENNWKGRTTLQNGGLEERELDREINGEFSDLIIKEMWAISKELNIPLNHIAIETHGCGEVFRYALAKTLKETDFWARDVANKRTFHIINPTQPVTDRYLFQTLGKLEVCNAFIADYSTELWFALRCAILSKQIFNIPDVILKQLYNRGLDRGVSGSGKWKLESKKDMRKRGVASPNDTDALTNAIELMRVFGAFKIQFALSGSYIEKFGKTYHTGLAQKKVDDRLSTIGRMLQVNENFLGNRHRQRSGGGWSSCGGV